MSTQINGVLQYEDGLKNGDDSRTVELDTNLISLIKAVETPPKATRYE